MTKSIKVESSTLDKTNRIKNRESHHSQNETILYLVELDKQIKKLGGIKKIMGTLNAKNLE